VGLLLLRLVAGIAAIEHALTLLRAGSDIGPMTLEVLAIAAGILLMAGLWTPVSASLLAAVELWHIFSPQPNNLFADILLGTIGAALALLGPGAWSYDARLFGWRRIDVRERRS
jgi:hypothetical protein